MATNEQRKEWIQKIADFPEQLASRMKDVPVHVLQKDCPPSHPTLDGDWTLAQAIHHIADSHIHAYSRMKFIVTEDRPTIKPWDQRLWAETYDARDMEIEDSILILTGLHRRWVKMLNNLQENDWNRVGMHPEVGEITMEHLLETYAKHGEDHLRQFELLLE